NHSEAKITSDSNIISYSQYVQESQQEAVQNSNLSAQQDALILFVIEQLKTQVVNCTKINLENKSVNDTLTTQLKRYKEQVKVLKEGRIVEVKSQDSFSDSYEQNAEIDRLKQTLSEQLQEKESLMKTVIVLKNDFKKEESRNIDREISLEKKIKHLDNIVYKRNQSVQTVYMLTKSKFFYDHTTKEALDPTPSNRPTKVDVPKEIPKVSMDLVIIALMNDLRKLKGKSLVNNVVTSHTIDLEMLKIDVEPIAPKLLNNRTVHSEYLMHSQKQAAILREVVKQGKSQNPLNNSLYHAFSNKSALSSTGVKPSTSASGSQPSGNTKKDKIQRPPCSTQKNKVEAHPRTVKSCLKNKKCAVEPIGTASVQKFKLDANSKLTYVKCNGCMLSDNHDLCVLNNVHAHAKCKSVKKDSKRKV
nr:hypothetical protein [Tanacetum cinerariifolium]